MAKAQSKIKKKKQEKNLKRQIMSDENTKVQGAPEAGNPSEAPKAEKAPKVKKVKVRILIPLAGKYLLSPSKGDIVSYPEAFANELVEDKYAEFVK